MLIRWNIIAKVYPYKKGYGRSMKVIFIINDLLTLCTDMNVFIEKWKKGKLLWSFIYYTHYKYTCVDLLDCLACLDLAFLCDSDSSSLTGVRYDLQ